MSGPLPREIYERTGGWKDGRFGQAYDAVCDALEARGVKTTGHPLLAQIEAADDADEVSS